jgi:hypothetical protein
VLDLSGVLVQGDIDLSSAYTTLIKGTMTYIAVPKVGIDMVALKGLGSVER